MNILYVQHDMLVWASARQWSYTTTWPMSRPARGRT